jgi:alpha-tubulin suppressor-like RCC1 family protein
MDLLRSRALLLPLALLAACGASQDFGAGIADSTPPAAEEPAATNPPSTGDLPTTPAPAPESSPFMDDVLEVAAGYSSSCALERSGAVSCWGSLGGLGIQAVPIRIAGLPSAKRIAGGGYHKCAIAVNDEVWCWGANWYGQLGGGFADPNDSRVDPSPLRVLDAAGKPLHARELQGGRVHTCAVAMDGTVHCWGSNDFGRLGAPYESLPRSAVARPVTGVADAVALVTGDDFTCAVTQPSTTGHRKLLCWGSNAQRQLGVTLSGGATESSTPVDVGIVVGKLAAGTAHVCNVSSSTATCWGANESGQSGPSTGAASLLERRDVWLGYSIPSAVAAAAGLDFTCFTALGGTQCIGQNDRGQLGNGGFANPSNGTSATPALALRVRALDDAIQIAAGRRHACAVRKSKLAGHGGQTVCWGANDQGQLGDGTKADASSPVVVLAALTTAQVTK